MVILSAITITNTITITKELLLEVGNIHMIDIYFYFYIATVYIHTNTNRLLILILILATSWYMQRDMLCKVITYTSTIQIVAIYKY